MKNEAEKETNNEVIYLDTRFGTIQIDPNKQIFFPNGLLGMAEFKTFGLAHFPNTNFADFKILQSLDQEDLSLIVIPANNNPDFKYKNLLPDEKIKACCDELQVENSKMAFLLITTVDRTDNPKKPIISVNLRAPIIINTETYNAVQYVFNDNNLDIKYQINLK
jgi:flagellar assembly factor FliW